MTLSIGRKIRIVEDDGITPVPNEVHVLFEVVELGPQTPDGFQNVTVKVIQ